MSCKLIKNKKMIKPHKFKWATKIIVKSLVIKWKNKKMKIISIKYN